MVTQQALVIKPLFSVGIARVGKQDMKEKNPAVQILTGKESMPIHEIPIKVMKFHFPPYTSSKEQEQIPK